MPFPFSSVAAPIGALLSALALFAGAAPGYAQSSDDINLRAPTRAFWHAIGVAVQKARDCDIPAAGMQHTVEFHRLQQRFLAAMVEVAADNPELATADDVAEAFREGENAQRASLPPTNQECIAVRRGWIEREAYAAKVVAALGAHEEPADGTTKPGDAR